MNGSPASLAANATAAAAPIGSESENALTNIERALMVTQNAPETSMSSYMIVAFVIIFLIFASIIYYMKDVFYSLWRSIYPISELTGEPISTNISESASSGTTSDTNNSTVIDYAGTTTSVVDSSMSDAAAAAATAAGATTAATAASAQQTWCLVGEDSAGRWCMQVQSDAHCDADRTYRTKNKCESADYQTLGS